MAVRIIPHVEAPPPVWAPPKAGPGRLRKIGLLGSHERTLTYAPWDDPSWELWGHASSRGYYKRPPERFFDLHRRECWSKSNNKGQKYLDFLHTNTVPIFMQERYPEIPGSIRYPLERYVLEFGRYATGHGAWMIGLALMEGVTHLGFFGVNYGKNEFNGVDAEYATQRGSCEYMMGVAHARGIHLVRPPGCTLLADPKELYGYESHDAEGALIESYRLRIARGPQKSPEAVAKDARGLAVPPPHLVDVMRKERAENPPPEGVGNPDDAVSFERIPRAALATWRP